MLEKETLTAVLQFTGCTELPAALKEGDIYVRAIAKVKKANNHETMCVIVNDGTGNPIIKKDFGSISMIKEIVEIYPLSVLESDSIPYFRKKKDIVNFLVNLGETESHVERLASSKEDEDKAALKALVYKHCIKLQIARENAKSTAQAKPVTPVVDTEASDTPTDTNVSGNTNQEDDKQVDNEIKVDETPNQKDNGTDENNTNPEETAGEDKATDSDF